MGITIFKNKFSADEENVSSCPTCKDVSPQVKKSIEAINVNPDFNIDISTLQNEFAKYQIEKISDECANAQPGPIHDKCQSQLNGYLDDAIFSKVFGSSPVSQLMDPKQLELAQKQFQSQAQSWVDGRMGIKNQFGNATLTPPTETKPVNGQLHGMLSSKTAGYKYTYNVGADLQKKLTIGAGLATCNETKYASLRGNAAFSLVFKINLQVSENNNYYFTYMTDNNAITASWKKEW